MGQVSPKLFETLRVELGYPALAHAQQRRDLLELHSLPVVLLEHERLVARQLADALVDFALQLVPGERLERARRFAGEAVGLDLGTLLETRAEIEPDSLASETPSATMTASSASSSSGDPVAAAPARSDRKRSRSARLR